MSCLDGWLRGLGGAFGWAFAFGVAFGGGLGPGFVAGFLGGLPRGLGMVCVAGFALDFPCAGFGLYGLAALACRGGNFRIDCAGFGACVGLRSLGTFVLAV